MITSWDKAGSGTIHLFIAVDLASKSRYMMPKHRNNLTSFTKRLVMARSCGANLQHLRGHQTSLLLNPTHACPRLLRWCQKKTCPWEVQLPPVMDHPPERE